MSKDKHYNLEKSKKHLKATSILMILYAIVASIIAAAGLFGFDVAHLAEAEGDVLNLGVMFGGAGAFILFGIFGLIFTNDNTKYPLLFWAGSVSMVIFAIISRHIYSSPVIFAISMGYLVIGALYMTSVQHLKEADHIASYH